MQGRGHLLGRKSHLLSPTTGDWEVLAGRLRKGRLSLVRSGGSVIFFFVEDDFRRILGVTAGLFCLLLAIWYAAHPFIKNERNYPELRRELDNFVDQVRELHYAAIRGDEAAFEQIKTDVPAQVERVISTARQSREPAS